MWTILFSLFSTIYTHLVQLYIALTDKSKTLNCLSMEKCTQKRHRNSKNLLNNNLAKWATIKNENGK